MLEADIGTTNAAMDNRNRYVGDETLLVRFFMHPKLQRQESEDEGRPIYKDVPYVQIMVPGNKDSIIQRPARQMDKDRFPEHWRRFEAKEDQQVAGTLLKEWAGITRSQVEEMKFLNIVTVEQLAAVADSNAANVRGIGVLKQKAAQFLDMAASAVNDQKFAELNEKYEALLARVEGEADLPEAPMDIPALHDDNAWAAGNPINEDAEIPTRRKRKK